MPFTLSLCLALPMAASMSSSPVVLTALPLISSTKVLSARSSSTPDSLTTSTVLSLTFFAELPEAIMPTMHISPMTHVSTENTIRPATVAAVYFKKSFINQRVIVI